MCTRPADTPYYVMVIGANMAQEQAKELTDEAINAGFSRDTYCKTFPNLPLL